LRLSLCNRLVYYLHVCISQRAPDHAPCVYPLMRQVIGDVFALDTTHPSKMGQVRCLTGLARATPARWLAAPTRVAFFLFSFSLARFSFERACMCRAWVVV
jgi:hypothetical protein